VCGRQAAFYCVESAAAAETKERPILPKGEGPSRVDTVGVGSKGTSGRRWQRLGQCMTQSIDEESNREKAAAKI